MTSMFQQLMLRFIPTDDGILTLQSFGIQLQNILHLADKGGIYFGQTPPLVQPRFEPPFFRQQRTVSAVIGSIYFSCTSLSAIICMVQQLRAAGGREPALAITYAPPLTPDFLDAASHSTASPVLIEPGVYEYYAPFVSQHPLSGQLLDLSFLDGIEEH